MTSARPRGIDDTGPRVTELAQDDYPNSLPSVLHACRGGRGKRGGGLVVQRAPAGRDERRGVWRDCGALGAGWRRADVADI